MQPALLRFMILLLDRQRLLHTPPGDLRHRLPGQLHPLEIGKFPHPLQADGDALGGQPLSCRSATRPLFLACTCPSGAAEAQPVRSVHLVAISTAITGTMVGMSGDKVMTSSPMGSAAIR